MNDSDDNPLVAVGMPVYNGGRHLRQAVDSLLAQSHQNFELIILDNASTDDTSSIAQEYARNDQRVTYIKNDRTVPVLDNFTGVFYKASAEYFMWAAHDDYWEPEYISRCLEMFRKYENIVLVGSKCRVLKSDESLYFIDEGFSTHNIPPAARLKKYKSVIHSGKHIGALFYGLYRRNSLESSLPFRKIIGSDHVLLASLCLKGAFITVPEILMTKRYGGASRSHEDNAKVTGVTNIFLIKFPYFVRELIIQKLIMSSSALDVKQKCLLCLWSWRHYYLLFPHKRLKNILYKIIRIPRKALTMILKYSFASEKK